MDPIERVQAFLQFLERGEQRPHGIRRTGRGFLAEELRRHFVIHFAKQANGRILLMQPIRESDGPIEDRVPIAVAEQTRHRLARLPTLLTLGLILRFTEVLDRQQSPI